MSIVQDIVEQILMKNGLELVEFNLKQSGKRSTVVIFTDTADGKVSLDQIAKVTSEINNSEEFYAELPEDFRLEVSSPGLTYPLKNFKDFKRNIDKSIQLKFVENDSKKSLSGQLLKVDEHEITLGGKFGEKVIPLTDIDHGQIEIKFK
jgi:ribosome maturation factor RimP